jgi:hypothetical protein
MIEHKIDMPTLELILEKLESLAVPVDMHDFSKEEYKKIFPHGRIMTPLGEVKIGENQYEKLRDRDGGKRRSLIGAMRQTLSDPVIVISEAEDGRKAEVYIKSFRDEGKVGIDTVMSVVVKKDEQRIAISTYKRKQREVVSKIKKADGIVFIKDNAPQPDEQGVTPAN